MLRTNQEMGKKSHKRSSTPAKVNAGCMWSFISKFEFSQSYNRHKLLSDRKRRSARYHGTGFLGNNHPENSFESKYGRDANDVDGLGASLPSVKLLIEEEMSKENVSKTLGSNLKSTCKMTKNQNIHSDPRLENLMVSAQVSFEQYQSRDPLEGSNLTFDLAALMIEFYCISHHFRDIHAELEADLCTPLNTSGQKKHSNLEQSDSQFAHRHSMLQEALGVEAEAFLCQKIDDVKRQVGNGSIQSQEFMDALEILNSNKELFLNLFQDPNSLIFKHIQEVLKPQIAEFSRLEAHHCLEVREQLEYIRNSDKSEKSNSNLMFLKQKQHYFSKEKDGSRGKDAFKFRNTSKEMSRIVVLKPRESNNEGDSASKSACLSPEPHYTHKLEKDGESVLSHFSFREIKRRLRNIIGERRKEQHLISRDGLLHKFPSGYKVSYDTDRINSAQNSRTNVASQTNCSAESTCQPYPGVSKTDKKVKAKQCQQKVEAETTQGKRQGIAAVSLLHRESYHEEAKKHLSEILGTEYKSNILKTSQVSKSMEKMLCKPDNNLLSPIFSPHSVKEKKLSPQLTLSSPKLQLIDDTPAKLSPLEESLKETPCTSSDLDVEKLVVDLEATNDKVNLQEETCNGELSIKGSVEVVETENVKSLDINPLEECDSLIILAASVGSEYGSCESCIEEGCTQSDQGTPNERSRILIPSASISPSSLIIADFGTSESIFEKPDRPSPVSVLEPFFLEDDASPDSARFERTQLRMSLAAMYLENYDDSEVFITTPDSPIACQRTYLYDKEAIRTFARTLLESCGLHSEMIPERWPSSDRLLQPSLLEEIQACHSSCIEDSKLVLDCVNEVLMEIKDRQCQFSPWVSFLKPSVRLILKENNIIQEVCKTIEKYPSSQLKTTLNEIMRKDMDSARWMDHRLEMECIIAETGYSIFEELVEETILEIFL